MHVVSYYDILWNCQQVQNTYNCWTRNRVVAEVVVDLQRSVSYCIRSLPRGQFRSPAYVDSVAWISGFDVAGDLCSRRGRATAAASDRDLSAANIELMQTVCQ